jgi:hypothetical protein
MRGSISERFWAKVKRGAPDECWLWFGAKGSKGHGQIFMNGRLHIASRVSWAMANGREFPADMMACHSCDNPPCVNPAHIWPGTNGDNMRDCVKKGRHDPRSRSRQTHCKRGHEFTSENTIARRDYPSRRICRICRDARNHQRYKSSFGEYASALAEQQAQAKRLK